MRDAVLLLATPGELTNIVYHALAAAFEELHVLIERRPSRFVIATRRARRIGWLPALGQTAFVTTVAPVLRHRSRKRIEQILREDELDASPIPNEVPRVESMNCDAAREHIQKAAAGVVAVFGTRVLSRATLSCVDAPFVNMHSGITPRYRGVHGAYWALVEGRSDLVGTTVHLVDEGIDTGAIVEQAHFAPAPEDNFATYPYLHVAAGLSAFVRAIKAGLEGRLETRAPASDPGRLRYHPSLFEYFRHRIP